MIECSPPGRALALLLLALCVISPSYALGPAQLGVVINRADPLSEWIGDYYAERRGIPAENVVRLHFPPAQQVLSRQQFEPLAAELKEQLPSEVQALVLTWIKPWRVDCMSITSAFTFGYDRRFCAKGCKLTLKSGYYDADTRRPFDELSIRPTMALAARRFRDAIRLIERGVDADGSHPRGTAYLISTPDRARNVRARIYPQVERLLGRWIDVDQIEARSISGRSDILFYFTGLRRVPDIDTNRYRPGAIADHLTSLGGVLIDSPQMSALEWLEAGATASYGNVVEPCNFTAKFPNPGIAIARYLKGETLIEAYWKSVAMPGQGIFIGEPLARPFPGGALANRTR